jgi:hypothetical protein
VLLRELLLAEWDLRRRHDQHIELETYLALFPRSRHCITDLWRVWREKQFELSLNGPASGIATAPHTARGLPSGPGRREASWTAVVIYRFSFRRVFKAPAALKK